MRLSFPTPTTGTYSAHLRFRKNVYACCMYGHHNNIYIAAYQVWIKRGMLPVLLVVRTGKMTVFAPEILVSASEAVVQVYSFSMTTEYYVWSHIYQEYRSIG